MLSSTGFLRRVPKLGVKAVALFWMGGCSTLFGQVLFDSLSDPPIGQPVGDPEEVQIAARFSTQSSTTFVTDIILRLQQVSSTGSYSVGLYNDNGLSGNADAPSAFLHPVANGNMGDLPTSFNDIHFSGLSLGVEPNTPYWVVVSTDDTSHTLEWAFSNTIMPGTAWSRFSSGSWNTTANGTTPQQMQVLTAVPEPWSSTALAALGLAAFAGWRRWALAHGR